MPKQGYHEIDRKAEDAWEAMLTKYGKGSSIEDLTIFPGFSGLDLEGARIEVLCETAVCEEIEGFVTGNYFCTMSIAYVRHYKDVTRAVAREAKRDLFDLCFHEDIVSRLNATDVARFHVFGGKLSTNANGNGWKPGQIQNLVNGVTELKSELTGILYCRPSLP